MSVFITMYTNLKACQNLPEIDMNFSNFVPANTTGGHKIRYVVFSSTYLRV